MATARRKPQQDSEERLYGPAQLFVWLTNAELGTLPVGERHRLAAERRQAAIEDYALARRMLVGEAERRFLVHPDRKITDRDVALRSLAQHGEPSGLNIRTRREERVVS